jgi:hypothetical protein
MALNVPSPAPSWSPAYQIRVNQALESNDLTNRKKGTDVELFPERLILRSPNGARWQITVSDAGAIGAVAL